MTTSIAAGDWIGELGADQALWGQGADAARVRSRSPHLVATAERAARDGATLVEPRVAYRILTVRSREPGRIGLSTGSLTGPLVSRRLAGASSVALLVVTIGPRLETRVSRMFGRDLPYAMALDGLGSAAVENVARSARRFLAERSGGNATASIAPGMEGWPLGPGQKEIFRLIGPDAAGVRLTAEGFLLPRKSLSLVIGLGAATCDDGEICDSCASRPRCRHRRPDGFSA